MKRDNCNLETVCDAVDVKICRPQTIELARRDSCHREGIANFLIKCESLFGRDRRLIWNVD
jgi:hypothetical protein